MAKLVGRQLLHILEGFSPEEAQTAKTHSRLHLFYQEKRPQRLRPSICRASAAMNAADHEMRSDALKALEVSMSGHQAAQMVGTPTPADGGLVRKNVALDPHENIRTNQRFSFYQWAVWGNYPFLTIAM